MGEPLDGVSVVAVDSVGNVFVAGIFSHNAFRIAPIGAIMEIITEEGDGLGNELGLGQGLALGSGDVVYVGGGNNAFSVVPFFSDGFETGDSRAWSDIVTP